MSEVRDVKDEKDKQVEEDEEEKGFKVTDRRRFEQDGDERAAEEQETQGAAAGQKPGPEGPPRSLPEIDFATFILSLSSSALVHLGELSRPDGARQTDHSLAKQTIDIIGMLREKTVGNLSEEETRLLEELLFDLRLKYVAATRPTR